MYKEKLVVSILFFDISVPSYIDVSNDIDGLILSNIIANHTVRL